MAFYEIPGQARNDGGQAPTRRPTPSDFFTFLYLEFPLQHNQGQGF